jgi:hypothetical protein
MTYAETQTDESHTDLKEMGEQADCSTQSCVVVDGKPNMTIKSLIEGAPIEWKIDTGAANTFISEEIITVFVRRTDLYWSKCERILKLQMGDL